MLALESAASSDDICMAYLQLQQSARTQRSSAPLLSPFFPPPPRVNTLRSYVIYTGRDLAILFVIPVLWSVSILGRKYQRIIGTLPCRSALWVINSSCVFTYGCVYRSGHFVWQKRMCLLPSVHELENWLTIFRSYTRNWPQVPRRFDRCPALSSHRSLSDVDHGVRQERVWADGIYQWTYWSMTMKLIHHLWSDVDYISSLADLIVRETLFSFSQ